MEIQVALTEINNEDVAFVWVPKYAILNNSQADNYLRDLAERVFRMPVILFATGDGHKPLLHGAPRQIEDLSVGALMSLPWKTYHIN